MIERMNERMNKWMSEWTNERMNKWMNERMNEWMNERMNEWTNEWMNEWTNEWMNEWMNILSLFLALKVVPQKSMPRKRFSRRGEKRGFLVAVMGSRWQWHDAHGCYGV